MCTHRSALPFYTLAILGLESKTRLEYLSTTLFLTKNICKLILNACDLKIPCTLQRVSSMSVDDTALRIEFPPLTNRIAARGCALLSHEPCSISTPSAKGCPFHVTWHVDLPACLALHAVADCGSTPARFLECAHIQSSLTYAVSQYFISRTDHGYAPCPFGALKLGLENEHLQHFGTGLWYGRTLGYRYSESLCRCPPQALRPLHMARGPRAAKIYPVRYGSRAGTTREKGGRHGA